MNLTAIETKPFVPAKDFALGQRFYGDLGSTIVGARAISPIYVTAARPFCCMITS